MIGKVKLTQEQADFIEKYLFAVADVEEMLEGFAGTRDLVRSVFHPLQGLGVSDLARALLIGYEVELEYKTGEWVRYWKSDSLAGIGLISSYKNVRQFVRFEGEEKWRETDCITRHATPEEIKAEKERRVWVEIEEGDVLFHKHRKTLGIFKYERAGYAEVVCGNDQYGWSIENFELYAKKVGGADD